MNNDSSAEDDRIRELRERYKKNVDKFVGDEDSEETVEEEEEEKKRRPFFILFWKYLAVFIGFFGFLAMLVWIVDSFVIPSYVHDKPIVEVPDLVGMPQDEAAKLLTDIGLTWEKNGEQYDPKHKPGQIVLQNPEPGIDVKAGRPIYLTISKGMERAKVPYLVGMSSREAMVQLVTRGLVMGQISYEDSEMFDRDVVLSQSIRNGKEIELGDTIHLTVSKGSELTIETPDLVGQDLIRARDIILDSGLLLGNISYEAQDDTFMPGTVLWQYPSSGNETLKGTYVELVVTGSGPPEGFDANNPNGQDSTSNRGMNQDEQNDPDVIRALQELWRQGRK